MPLFMAAREWVSANLSTIDSSWSRINSKFLKSIRIQESLILASDSR